MTTKFEGCQRNGHHYFVADVVLVPDEGNVIMLALCTACGEPLSHPIKVSAPGAQLELNSIQKKQLEGARHESV